MKYLNWNKIGDQLYPFGKTLQFINDLFGSTTETQLVYNPTPRIVKPQRIITSREDHLVKISNYKPSEYFHQRGFSLAVLRKFDVVSCMYKNNYFSNRSLVPTYDEKGKNLLGISGRTECGAEPKWLHTKEFPSSTNLYGLWLADDYIKRTRSAILCEGPGNVWRLNEAGICNAVAMWGTSFSEAKRFLLDRLGVVKIALALDNDNAGRIAIENIKKRYASIYNIQQVILPDGVNDVADLSVGQVKDLFHDYR